MSVTFRVKGEPRQRGFEMTNHTARIVLRMLGLPSEGYLEGRLLIPEAQERLMRIGADVVRAHVEMPRVLGPGWFEHGVSEERLRECVEGLRDLVAVAVRLRRIQIVWD